jgi:hypothetical protein
MTPAQLVDELTYRHYVWQRVTCPRITPGQWAVVFDDAAKWEARYQAEQERTQTT